MCKARSEKGPLKTIALDTVSEAGTMCLSPHYHPEDKEVAVDVASDDATDETSIIPK